MSTRCMIKFGEKRGKKLVAEAMIYQHSDGYPNGWHGVLVLMQRFFRAVEKDADDTRFNDPEFLAAKFVVWVTQTIGRKYASSNFGKDGPLNFLSHGVSLREHGDIEYCYFVDCSRKDEQGRPLILVRRGRLPASSGKGYRLEALDEQGRLAVEKLNAEFGAQFELEQSFVVVAREDKSPSGEKGSHTLCTRKLFSSRSSAEEYAKGVSSSREPLVIGGRFHELYER
jgi:hypothetical protein